MQVKQTLSENLKREYKVTVPANDIQTTLDSKLQEIGKTMKLPGFRPGKVPMNLVKKQHGQRVMGEILEKVVDSSAQKALDDEGIRPAMRPKFEIITFEDGKDLEYKMEFEVIPELPKVDVKKISIEQMKVDVADKDIEDALEKIAEQSKHFHTKEGKKAENGDAIIIDFKGFVGDEAFEGGEAQGHQLELGSNSFIPGFEEQLVGAKAGDKKDVNVKFPKEYHSADLAGKDAKFEVTVHEVQEAHTVKKPDDHLAETIGFESLEKLKEAISGQIESEAAQTARSFAKKELFDYLDENLKFDVPESMLEGEFKGIWSQFERAKKEEPDNPEYNRPEKELKEEYQEMASRRVRLGLYLAELGREQNVEVSKDDLTQAIVREAQNYPGQEAKIFEYYRTNKEALEAMRGPILEEKVVDYLLENIKVTEKKVTIKELNELSEAPEQQQEQKPKKKAAAKKTAKKSDNTPEKKASEKKKSDKK